MKCKAAARTAPRSGKSRRAASQLRRRPTGTPVGGSPWARLETKLDEGSKHQKYWKQLELLTEPAFALGLLGVGIAVPSLGLAVQDLDLAGLVTKFLPAMFLLWIGLVLLRTPVELKAHFLAHENHLEKFSQRFSGSDRASAAQAVLKWASSDELRGTDVSRQLRQAVLAFRVGLLFAVLLVLLLFSLHVGILYLAAREYVGVWEAAGLVALLLALYFGVLWVLVRGSRGMGSARQAA